MLWSVISTKVSFQKQTGKITFGKESLIFIFPLIITFLESFRGKDYSLRPILILKTKIYLDVERIWFLLSLPPLGSQWSGELQQKGTKATENTPV